MKESLKMVIPLSCDGNCSEKVEIRSYDWGDGDKMITLSFVGDTFYAGQSIIGIARERLKFAWEALRKGNYIHNEIITDKKALSEFNGKVTEFLDREFGKETP